MKLLLALLVSVSSFASARAPISIEAFPGRVKVEVDLNMSAGSAVDVLFVVDSSGSMEQHQIKLRDHVSVLVDKLVKSGVDYHAGVTTTDMEGVTSPGKGLLIGPTRVVTSQTPDAAKVLAGNLMVGTRGAATEEMFTPVMAALTEPMLSGPNAGFFRPGADLAIVYVTDAEDQSQVTPEQFSKFLTDLTGNASQVSVQAILVPTGDKTCPRDAFEEPVKLEAVIKNFGGHAASLCAQNYEENLVKIAERMTANVGPGGSPVPGNSISRIPLPSEPEFSTISVNYGSQVLNAGDLHGGWVFDAAKNEIALGNRITWSVQPKGTPLTINYVPKDWAR